MFDGLAGALQDSALAIMLRGSLWVYPLVNAGHIVGIALLIGGIVPMDLRLLGLWRTVPAALLARVLVPSALVGGLVVLVTGPLLFIVRAQDYVDNSLFLLKMGLIAAALLNALLLRATEGWRHLESLQIGTTPRLRLAGLLSAGLWLAVLVCGRLVGYA